MLLLGLKTTTPTSVMYGVLGLDPLNFDIKVRRVSYWAGILNGKENNFISYCINCCLIFKCWMKYSKSILNECSISYIWDQRSRLNLDSNNNIRRPV